MPPACPAEIHVCRYIRRQMHIEPYRPDEMGFAFCYHVYVRWHTWRRQPFAQLPTLDLTTANTIAEQFGLRVLECAAQTSEVLLLLSLQPQTSVSAAVGTLKGQISKWLNHNLGLEHPARLFGRGYFACTSGKSSSETVAAYLDSQGDHHGYASRVVPPVFVRSFPQGRDEHLQTDHAATLLQFHMVLATMCRKGVFGQTPGERVTDAWRSLEREFRFSLRKVSFVPDHVHVALQLHPAVAPAETVLALMNSAQETIASRCELELIRAAIPRLWQPGAYVGSYGDLVSPKLAKYIQRYRGNQPTE